MWIFTKWGFISVVEDKSNPSFFVVRSREKYSLEEVVSRLEKDYEIFTNIGTDYIYRIFVPKEEFVYLMVKELNSIGYNNFKQAAEEYLKEDEWLNTLANVWFILYRYQESCEEQYVELENNGCSSPWPA